MAILSEISSMRAWRHSFIPTPNSSTAPWLQSLLDHLPPPRLFPTDTSHNAFGLQLVRIVTHTGLTQVESFSQRLAGDGWISLDDVDHRFFGWGQFLMDSLLASFMASERLFLDSAFLRLFQEGGAVEGDDEQIADFAENDVRRIFKDQRHAAAPGFHHLDAAKQIGN